jgi:hypothetical protein
MDEAVIQAQTLSRCNAESDAVVCDASSVSRLALARNFNPPLRALSICYHAVPQPPEDGVLPKERARVAGVADGALGVRLALRIYRNQAIRRSVEDPRQVGDFRLGPLEVINANPRSGITVRELQLAGRICCLVDSVDDCHLALREQ